MAKATPSLQSVDGQGHRDGLERQVLRGRGPSSQGEVWSVRQYLRDGVATTERNGGLLPWMDTRCWEWTWRHGPGGAFEGGAGDRRDNSVTAQRAALILAGRTLRPGEHVGAACGDRRCVRPGHLVVGTLGECRALRARGPSPLGPGGVWLIRDVVRSGEGTAEQIAEAYGTSPEFIAAVARTR